MSHRGTVMVTAESDREIESVLASRSMLSDPHDVYHRLRASSPVYFSPTAGGWLVTSYDLVEEMLTDPTRFSSAGAEVEFIDRLHTPDRPRAEVVRSHFSTPQLNTSDPPGHTRIRRAFGRSFTKQAVQQYRTTITAAASDLVDEAIGAGSPFDAVVALAEPLPVRVVADVVGVPPSDRQRISRVTMDQRRFFGTTAPDADVAHQFSESLGEWHELMATWLNARRRDPRNDIITQAARLIDAGELTPEEASATLLHFIIAGNGTTTALIGNALFALATHPDQLADVRHNRGLVGNAIEETLRWESPLPRDRRIAVARTTLGGETMEPGERVFAVLAAANRDPAQFPQPDRFDIQRTFKPKHHVAFGRGIHFCLGAPLARLEATIAIDVMLDRLPAFQPSSGFEPVWHDVPTHRGLKSLPLEAAA